MVQILSLFPHAFPTFFQLAALLATPRSRNSAPLRGQPAYPCDPSYYYHLNISLSQLPSLLHLTPVADPPSFDASEPGNQASHEKQFLEDECFFAHGLLLLSQAPPLPQEQDAVGSRKRPLVPSSLGGRMWLDRQMDGCR